MKSTLAIKSNYFCLKHEKKNVLDLH